MADASRPEVVTLADFIKHATSAAGGTDELSRRLGISTPTLLAMSSSDSLLLEADATALFEAFGLTRDAVPGASPAQPVDCSKITPP